MTAPSATIHIPQVLDRFVAYYKENPSWGSLHIALDDDNVDSDDILFCRDEAIRHKDREGEDLAVILLQLSHSQRLRIHQKVKEALIKENDKMKAG